MSSTPGPTDPVEEIGRIHVVGAAILLGARCLAARRGPGMALPLKWEFPGGKVLPEESAQEALVREIKEELGLEITVGDRLAEGTDGSAGREIWLEVFRAELAGGSLHLAEHQEVRWIDAEELDDLDWAVADLPAVEALRSVMSEPE